MAQEQPNYYSILPASIRYDKDIKANEKILFSEIAALANRQGYCHAKNNYFAELYDKSTSTISEWINHLKKQGYLKVEMVYNDKQIVGRKLYPIADPKPIKENQNTSLPKHEEGIPKKPKGYTRKAKNPIPKKPKDNITSINNTSMNITSNNKPLTDDGHSIQEIFDLWENNWGFPNGIAQQDLTEWTNRFGNDLVYYCIEFALRRNINSKGADRYIFRKLNAYKKQGIKTVDEAKQDDDRHEQQMSREYQSMGGRRRPVHADPVKKDYTPPKGFDR